MTKYIVSTEVDGKYNHEAVKLAYRHKAVVEFWLSWEESWIKVIGTPVFSENVKYRIIIDSDAPYFIKEMVNLYDNDDSHGKTLWADVIIAMANGLPVDYKHEGRWKRLTDTALNPFSHPHFEWRVAPKTIMIGDMEIGSPVGFLEPGKKYFAPEIGSPFLYSYLKLASKEVMESYLVRRLVHETEESAIEHARALIKISGGSV